jgi:hypothetical protein
MSGAILETHLLCEMLKSWWHRGKAPKLYYYRDRDDNEIDFLFQQDQVFYPIEVKKTASPRQELAQPFKALARLKQSIGKGAVLCLCNRTVPLAQDGRCRSRGGGLMWANVLLQRSSRSSGCIPRWFGLLARHRGE